MRSSLVRESPKSRVKTQRHLNIKQFITPEKKSVNSPKGSHKREN